LRLLRGRDAGTGPTSRPPGRLAVRRLRKVRRWRHPDLDGGLHDFPGAVHQERPGPAHPDDRPRPARHSAGSQHRQPGRGVCAGRLPGRHLAGCGDFRSREHRDDPGRPRGWPPLGQAGGGVERGDRRGRTDPGRRRHRGRSSRLKLLPIHGDVWRSQTEGPPTISDVPEKPDLEQVQLAADGHVATVTLNRPEQRNPLSATMLRDLASAFTWCRDESDVRVVILTGAGRVFCAGADLSSFDGEMTGLERYHSRDLFVDLFVLMAELGKPIVGRINGHALAGGLGLACSCDMLVAVDTATFGTPEINVGIWPMMIQAILSRNIPRKVLLEMEMLGDRWTADQLHSLGVINRVVPHEQLDPTVTEIAEQLAKKSPVRMRPKDPPSAPVSVPEGS